MDVKRRKISRAMTQYYEIKEKFPDTILLFQMGDFYETFDNDAKVVSKLLDIVLTAKTIGERGKEIKIPLAGFPVRALETHLAKIISAGYKVAVCEQVEKAIPGKLVKREITRVITPGTVYESSLIGGKENNFLMSISINERAKKFGIGLIDISTGDFYVIDYDKDINDNFINVIEKFSPKEVIFPDIKDKGLIRKNFEKIIIEKGKIYISPVNDTYFNYETANMALLDHFQVNSLYSFGIEGNKEAISAAGALIIYLKSLQEDFPSNIKSLKLWTDDKYLLIDANTLRNLEVLHNIYDYTTEGSLIDIFLRNISTSYGARLLRLWITNPLLEIADIEERLVAVTDFIKNPSLLTDIQSLLSDSRDIQRLFAKINFKSALPRDLLAVKNTFIIGLKIYDLLATNKDLFDNYLVNRLVNFDISVIKEIINLIEMAIVEDPSNSLKEGNLIKPTYNEELLTLHNKRHNSKEIIENIELREKKKLQSITGKEIKLKLGYNSVHGYYIEITKAQLREIGKDKIPPEYTRRQTLVNAERFITPELKKIEEEIVNIDEKINDLEYSLYCDVRDTVSSYSDDALSFGDLLAKLDVILCFSSVSLNNCYVRPEFVREPILHIKEGRHPVVEQMLSEGDFTPNDLVMDAGQLHIITGPNMSGKSTYIRQAGHIVILAQVGCYVPAKECKMGVFDRIFSRIGALDRLALGHSTFMMEMLETAYILNNATSRSLIILDEVGRGTGTFDGVSLAYSIAKNIVNNIKAKTLFATHYHMLAELEKEYPGLVKNYHMTAIERNNDLVLLHKLKVGSTDHSFGIHVAKMAGIPKEVIIDAQKKLIEIESENKKNSARRKKSSQQKLRQLTLTEAFRKSSSDQKYKQKFNEIKNEILAFCKTYSDIDILHITPIDSLKILGDIVEQLNNLVNRIEKL